MNCECNACCHLRPGNQTIFTRSKINITKKKEINCKERNSYTFYMCEFGFMRKSYFVTTEGNLFRVQSRPLSIVSLDDHDGFPAQRWPWSVKRNSDMDRFLKERVRYVIPTLFLYLHTTPTGVSWPVVYIIAIYNKSLIHSPRENMHFRTCA